MDKEKKAAKKAAKSAGYGYGGGATSKASKEERIAVRGTGARKAARKGELVALYTEGKGARLATSKNSGATVARVNTLSSSGKKSTASSSYGEGSTTGSNKRVELTREANAQFYGGTKLGQKLHKKAVKKGSPGVSGGFKEVNVKKRYKGKTT